MTTIICCLQKWSLRSDKTCRKMPILRNIAASPKRPMSIRRPAIAIAMLGGLFAMISIIDLIVIPPPGAHFSQESAGP